ncbi:hypothetical protein [Chryseobacterium sp. SL1]|uniref:hypothetical protein n=1 Tax=Chryseobacterium sp. SL1 TaxID=2995159 RepID=UPI00227633F9|nr:hypothetical protein [Chryseobacterium sp. SL1]MCY1663356.1 hypothetical protein [Chryseobacterium sp. SL1]
METILCIKNISEIIEAAFTSIAIIIGGGWTFWRFVLHREDHPKIQFDIDINFISLQNEQILFEVLLIIENKGLVRHKIDAKTFTLKMRYLTKDDVIIQGNKEINYQINFPHLHAILEDGKINTEISRKIVPEKWDNTFVDPGIIQKYSYIAALPQNTQCILVTSRFKYSDAKSDYHCAQKVFNVAEIKKNS